MEKKKKKDLKHDRGATMAAGRQNEELKERKKKIEEVHLITTLPLLQPPNARTMADSPREQKFKHRRSPKTSQEVPSPTSFKKKKERKTIIITSFVAMIHLTSKYNTMQVNSRNLFTGRQSYLK